MKMNCIRSGAAVIAILGATAATAQDFQGPYVGGHIGWQQMDIQNPESSLGALAIDQDRQAFTGGIFAGYDHKVTDRIVLGLEAGMDFGADDAIETVGAGTVARIDPVWSFELTARAGYLMTPKTLVYVRGGYTNAQVETSLTSAAGTVTDTENRNGWVVGAGLERQILPRVTVRLEYRFADLSEGDGSFDRHRILAGVAYRF